MRLAYVSERDLITVKLHVSLIQITEPNYICMLPNKRPATVYPTIN